MSESLFPSQKMSDSLKKRGANSQPWHIVVMMVLTYSYMVVMMVLTYMVVMMVLTYGSDDGNTV